MTRHLHRTGRRTAIMMAIAVVVAIALWWLGVW